jgi:3-oxoacyl-[acyl-carrier protein] reductase
MAISPKVDGPPVPSIKRASRMMQSALIMVISMPPVFFASIFCQYFLMVLNLTLNHSSRGGDMSQSNTPSHKEFDGKVALVTGGSRGIGRAVCLALAEQGAALAINYHSDKAAAEATQQAVQALGARCQIVQADVSAAEQVERMVQTVEQQLGPVDLLVTSAGKAEVHSHDELDFAAWQQIMRVNLDGTFLPIWAVKDGMIERGYGRMVCIASIAGLAPRGRMIAYSTSKAGVIALVRNCAQALAPAVRVNGLAPGLIITDMTADMNETMKQTMVNSGMLKRMGSVEEMAETVLFLLSDRSSFTTGQTLVADGGRVTLP